MLQTSGTHALSIKATKNISAIVWLVPFLSCVCYHIGTSAPCDTGLSWVAVQLGGDKGQTYEECGIRYRRLMALRWSPTQIDSGSMQVVPFGMAKQCFNVACPA